VLLVGRWVLMRPRRQVFHTYAALNEAFGKLQK